ncbi:MAG: peptidoglycan DD-metalloendopeptidase family protein [Solobacterium sp.]|nr:peptidoglycan DD-metalloendopeptidase family protein [Solobacterium sp.]MCI7445239.1 peptidoglycan DD-metalloendopeptidase family protein [Solobacterium sp.]
MRKNIFSLCLVFCMVLCTVNYKTVTVMAGDCDYSDCDENDKTCKLNNAKKKQQCLQNEIDNAKSNQEEYWKLASEWAKEAETLNEQIAELKPQIEELTVKIDELQKSIEEKEKLVSELNTRVLSRMSLSQGTMHFSPLLDFLLGSNGFADMLRRLYGIEAINAKEQQDRKELEDVIESLNKEKAELDVSKQDLDNKMTDLEIKSNEAEYKNQQAMIAYNEASDIIAEYQNQLDEQTKLIANIKLSLDELNQLDPQSGFISPVPGSSISANFPYYPASFGGGVHLGVDYAVSVGSRIVAPADGVVVISDDNCPTWGYLGNSCGGAGGGVSYGGNQIYFLCSVNGKVYALTFSHLYSGSLIGTGVVTKGTQLAMAGSSGNSTGPHCHIEMFLLGDGDNSDLATYIDMLNNGSYSKSFNCGWGGAGLNTICERKGSAPCRLNGANYLP